MADSKLLTVNIADKVKCPFVLVAPRNAVLAV